MLSKQRARISHHPCFYAWTNMISWTYIQPSCLPPKICIMHFYECDQFWPLINYKPWFPLLINIQQRYLKSSSYMEQTKLKRKARHQYSGLYVCCAGVFGTIFLIQNNGGCHTNLGNPVVENSTLEMLDPILSSNGFPNATVSNFPPTKPLTKPGKITILIGNTDAGMTLTTGSWSKSTFRSIWVLTMGSLEKSTGSTSFELHICMCMEVYMQTMTLSQLNP